jgi:hypothetical protein
VKRSSERKRETVKLKEERRSVMCSYGDDNGASPMEKRVSYPLYMCRYEKIKCFNCMMMMTMTLRKKTMIKKRQKA